MIFGTDLSLGDTSSYFVESSDAVDLETKLTALFAYLAGLDPVRAIGAINLSGSGDGDAFVVEVVSCPTGDAGSIVAANAVAMLFSASPASPSNVGTPTSATGEFYAQRAIAVTRRTTPIASKTLRAAEAAGAAKGLQHMYLELYA
jgi:hypothetical protein